MQKLSNFGFNVYSQYGEDGILAKIFEVIGTTSKTCIEFGAWDGFHLSNTAQLWAKQGWRAILIEANAERVKQLMANTKEYSCRCVHARVEMAGDNKLENILKREGVSGAIDLLSIDIDGDDYYVFESLTEIRPRVIVCEYNPTIPPDLELVASSGSYFGCSPLSLVKLGESKGYKLVAVTDCNCLFVQAADFAKFSQFETSLPALALTTHLTYLITGYGGDYLLSRKPPYGCNRRSQQNFTHGEAFYWPRKEGSQPRSTSAPKRSLSDKVKRLIAGRPKK